LPHRFFNSHREVSTTLSMLTIVFSLSVLDSAGDTDAERSRDESSGGERRR